MHASETCWDLVGRTHRSASDQAESDKPSDTGSQEQLDDREEHQSLRDNVTNLR